MITVSIPVALKWSDQWLQLVEEFVGHPYEAMFAIHIPSLTVRDMDGDPSVIYLGKHSAASIQDLEKIIGVGQFNRLKELIEFCVGNHCRLSNKAPSTCDILTPITIEADQEAYYLVKIRPIISGKSFEPEALLVALAETIPMDDERDWALVSIDKGANLIDLSYTDNHWEDSGSIGFTKTPTGRAASYGHRV